MGDRKGSLQRPQGERLSRWPHPTPLKPPASSPSPGPPWDPREARGTLTLRGRAWEMPQHPTVPKGPSQSMAPPGKNPSLWMRASCQRAPPRPSGASSSQALVPGPHTSGPPASPPRWPCPRVRPSPSQTRAAARTQAEGSARPSWLHGGQSLNGWGLGLLQLAGRWPRPRHLWPGSGTEPGCEGLRPEQTAQPPSSPAPA